MLVTVIQSKRAKQFKVISGWEPKCSNDPHFLQENEGTKWIKV